MSGERRAALPVVRRVPLAVAGGLLMAGAVLGFGLWANSVSDQRPVLVTARALDAGDVLTASDLAVVSVSANGVVASVPADAEDSIVGQTVAADVPAGLLMAAGMVGPVEERPANTVVVGAVLEPGRFPVGGLEAGDSVSLVATSGDDPVRLGDAEVFAVGAGDERSGAVWVSLLLPDGLVVDEVVDAAAGSALSVVVR